MKYIGIDYGRMRTGIAISDREGHMAIPKETITTRSQQEKITRIKELVEREEVQCVVVGLPLQTDGRHVPLTEEVERFVEKLRNHLAIPVQTMDERFTTALAKKLLHKAPREARDRVAAQILLQNFLDAAHSSLIQ